MVSVRGAKSGLEANTDITEGGISIRNRGKGRQCFIKTEFALRRHQQQGELHSLLLEEPENHLSHVSMKKLVNQLAAEQQKQLFIATHSSHISSRLDLRKAILFGESRPVLLNELSDETAAFFMKAPDNNVLEFALARRVLLVEGDAEYILIESFTVSSSMPSLKMMVFILSLLAVLVSAVILNWHFYWGIE